MAAGVSTILCGPLSAQDLPPGVEFVPKPRTVEEPAEPETQTPAAPAATPATPAQPAAPVTPSTAAPASQPVADEEKPVQPQIVEPAVVPVSTPEEVAEVENPEPAEVEPAAPAEISVDTAPAVVEVVEKPQPNALPLGNASPKLKTQTVSLEAKVDEDAMAEPELDPILKEFSADPNDDEGLGADQGALRVRPNARAITLSIPAPRGQIIDRNGVPMAQNRVVWYPAIKYPQFDNPSKEFVINWGRERLNKLNEIFMVNWELSDDALWQHYRHRRWLAYPFTKIVEEEELDVIKEQLIPGLILQARYARYYPGNDSACHILGYVGASGKLESGPINYGDPLFEFSEGRAGFEKLFNDELTGKPGLKRLIYDSDGSERLNELARRPKPGGTVVTTLDARWQKHAEDVLKEYSDRGAFVVIDIHTGEVLAMASRPGFDLNDFIPFVSTKTFTALKEDPGRPLYARAFQASYPPASTFKPIVALAALSEGVIGEFTLINCPIAIQIGNHLFHNWNRKVAEGDIDVKRAIARSCNTWFYQVGIRSGPTSFLSLARRLGYGKKTGLPLIGETSGLVPTGEWMRKHHGRRIMDGDTANLSIGQGVLLASPLQVAHGMAGLGSGVALPKLHLIKQIQDVNGRVLEAAMPDEQNKLYVDPRSADIVKDGMREVVNEPWGTGKSAALDFAVVAGKTGTAQWGPESKNQRLAWFAGFFPFENPRYAYAVLYEGRPNEQLSGGRKAAPMVKAFFNEFKDEIKATIQPPPRAMVIEEEIEMAEEDIIREVNTAQRAVLVDEDEDGETSIFGGGDQPIPLAPAGRAILIEE
ncbi:penicillin-binding transpeptidase domain-containing protein [Persicirhabdus sediminis]|uniref:penicillin-binding transpeptidase domain-containing protein n=1 Tax=Persicirhabdus sediminis TaxID=454144 RepID=UPI001F1C57E0|nr:penicillin-binding transpeptidase domain-containing protein [Persicirhabdus sediminis]